MAYYGKYNLSKKAVDIELLKIEPITFPPNSLTPLGQMPPPNSQNHHVSHLSQHSGMIGGSGLEMGFSSMNLYGIDGS
jgi:hypothetical protein